MRPCVRRTLACFGLASLAGCGAGVDSPAFGLFRPAVAVPLPAGARPAAIVMADFDPDGRLDVALADPANDGVVHMRGVGDGSFTFALETPLDPGSDPSALAVGDVDRDGHSDLVVATRRGDEVVFLRGVLGSFTPLVSFPLPTGAQASGIAVADFDDDGRVDIAVTNRALSSVTVALGIGDGTFALVATYTIAAGFRPSGLVVRDFDHDGAVDLALAGSSGGDVAILLGVGDGTFGPATLSTVDTGAELTAIATADVDRDGNDDLVVADRDASAAIVLLGNGDGTFSAPTAFHAGSGPMSVAIADVDRDGALDIAVAVNGTGSASLLLGHGDGTFEPGALFGTAGTGSRSLAVGDVDGDGFRDVVVADETSGSVGVLIQR